MTTLKIGQKVYTTSGIEGTVLELKGTLTTVDINGTSKDMMTMILKSKPVVKKTKKDMKEVEVKETFNSVVNGIKGSKQSRGSMFGFADIYTKLEKLAFSKNHFSGSIIEDARNGKFISEKQAQVVAYFAKNNNLI